MNRVIIEESEKSINPQIGQIWFVQHDDQAEYVLISEIIGNKDRGNFQSVMLSNGEVWTGPCHTPEETVLGKDSRFIGENVTITINNKE